MKTPHDVLCLADELGVELAPQGGLIIASPTAAITPELGEGIRKHKAAILRQLTLEARMVAEMSRPHLTWEWPDKSMWWRLKDGLERKRKQEEADAQDFGLADPD